MSRDALIVGINKYKSDFLSNLSAPAYDAEAIGKMLETYGEFNVWRLPEALDRDTKKPIIGQTLELSLNQLQTALVKLFKPDSKQIPDTALFYFSGHGLRQNLGISEGFLATSDVKPESGFNGLSLQWLRRLLQESPVRQQIIWLDCCHSGELINFEEANSGGQGKAKDYFFLASSREFEVAYEDLDSEYSVVTKILLEGLNPHRYPQEWVTNYSLVDYINKNLTNANQRPICSNAGEKINLTRTSEVKIAQIKGKETGDICPYKGLEYFTFQLNKINTLLKDGAEGLTTFINASQSEKVVIVIDQFEEVFTLCQDLAERENFFQCILGALNQTEKLCLIVAMRADFLLKCLEHEYSGLHKQIQKNLITVTPMNKRELKEAIIKPAEKAKLIVEDTLVTQMLTDVKSAPSSLPLLEDTLTELWKRRNNNVLELDTYIKLGGVTGTLNQRATEVYRQFDTQEKDTAKYIFLTLTTLGEGTEDTRRRVIKGDLITAKYPESLIDRVVQKLADEKLIVTDNLNKKSPPFEGGLGGIKKSPPFEGGLGGIKNSTSQSESKGIKKFLPFQSELGGITSQPQQGEIIDVAHEALIRNWQLLREWLNESRDNLRKQRKFNTLAQEWQNQGRKADYLLTGKRLKEAKDFHQENGEKYPLSSLTISFIKASSQNRLKSLAVYGIIPLIVVTIGTYLGFREYQIQSHLNLLRDCPKPTENQKEEDYLNCEGRINALEKLAKAKRLPKYANLEYANLYSANLNSANLESANLNFANLYSANLYSAKLNSANLESANLESANLESANLESANLESANLTNAKNLTNEQIKSACYWEKAYFAKRWDENQYKWVVNEAENQKRIAEIKADKSSDPETPVDCSWWE